MIEVQPPAQARATLEDLPTGPPIDTDRSPSSITLSSPDSAGAYSSQPRILEISLQSQYLSLKPLQLGHIYHLQHILDPAIGGEDGPHSRSYMMQVYGSSNIDLLRYQSALFSLDEVPDV
ncbi:hypothetical protein LTR53_010393 [Teratosphaeriaceae sp. CCFEE 6253]|nr:hypothetical protein LTR53_010393 [Teratosphaeriaceae sp. CCFEE 6253]